MIPLWYTVILMALSAAAGYLLMQLVPLTTTAYRLRVLRRSTRMVAELQRLTGAFAPPRHKLTPPDEDRWSLPVSPRLTDRPRIDAAKKAAMEAVPVETALAVRHSAPTSDIDWHRGEHRTFSLGWAVEVVARLLSTGAKPNLPLAFEEYKPRHRRTVGEITQEFDRIVAVEFDSHRCDSCTVGRDGEPEPLPEGADGYAIAGGTR